MNNIYTILVCAGILCGFGVLFYFEKKDKIDKKFMDFVVVNGLIAILIGMFCAALFQGIYNYIDGGYQNFSLTGGVTFIGGLIGGCVSFISGYLIYRKRLNVKLIDHLYIFPPAILIGHSIGRIGCFFSKCCFGKETTSWIGVMVNGKRVLPTNLFEAIFLFIMFAITFIIGRKKKTPQTMTLYVFSYGVWRFFIEFYRGDYRGSFVRGMSPSQFWSLMMIALSFVMYVFFKKHKKTS